MGNTHSGSAVSFETLAGNAMRAVLARREHVGPAVASHSQATLRQAVPIGHSGLPRSGDIPGSFRLGECPPERPRFDECKVLYLTSWPSMRELPPDRLMACARVCALLSLGPSVGFLVHRRLGLPRAAVLPVLEALHADGHLRLAGAEGQQTEATDTSPTEFDRESTRRPNVWTKLLAKLLN